MEFRQLVTFRKVAGLLSFTRAAEELNYAQSSVTSQIRALETSLGVELFDRLGGRIRLTPAGEKLVRHAERILESVEAARADVTGGPAATLVVGTMESITSYRMPPLLEFLHHRHPGLRLALRPSLCAETRQALRQGTYDVGFLMERETEHPGLETVVLTEEPLVLVGAPGHALAGERALTLDELRAVPVLATEAGCAYRDLFEEQLGGEFLEFGTIEAIKRSVGSGLGIALLPEVTVAEELARGDMVVLRWRPSFTVHTQLAWRSGRLLPAEVRLFVDEAVRLMRAAG